jgi:hypothetical protein
MKKNSLYEYDIIQEDKLKQLYNEELSKCFDEMLKLSETHTSTNYKSLIYIVPFDNIYTSKWDHKKACVFIIKKLRKKLINVNYRKPNKLYIHWKIKKKSNKESKEINNYLNKEDKKFVLIDKNKWNL